MLRRSRRSFRRRSRHPRTKRVARPRRKIGGSSRFHKRSSRRSLFSHRRRRRTPGRSSGPRVVSQFSTGRTVGRSAPRPTRVGKRFQRRVTAAQVGLRTIIDDTASVSATFIGQSHYFFSVLMALSDVNNMFVDAVNQFPTAVAALNLRDLQLSVESAMCESTYVNGANTPVTLNAYWLIPRYDLPNTGPTVTDYLNSVFTSSIGLSNRSTTDMNVSVWQMTALLRDFKIVKQKTQTLLPGCSSTFITSVGKRIVTYRRWEISAVSTVNTIPPSYARGVTKLCLVRASGSLVKDSTSGGITTSNVDVGQRHKYTYKYRPLIDNRPQYDISSSVLTVATTDSATLINPVSGVLEGTKGMV